MKAIIKPRGGGLGAQAIVVLSAMSLPVLATVAAPDFGIALTATASLPLAALGDVPLGAHMGKEGIVLKTMAVGRLLGGQLADVAIGTSVFGTGADELVDAGEVGAGQGSPLPSTTVKSW